MGNRQEHQLEHWKQAGGGHKNECKRLKAETEAAEAEAAAELARLSLEGAAGSSRAGASGRSSGGVVGPSRGSGGGRGGSAAPLCSGIGRVGGANQAGSSGGGGSSVPPEEAGGEAAAPVPSTWEIWTKPEVGGV